MRILLIRHADPDYSIDSLTEKGWREARLLADRLVNEGITDFYCSPMGRAKDTLSFTLERLGRTAEILPWSEEFHVRVQVPGESEQRGIPWDFYPATWNAADENYSIDTWLDSPVFGTVEGAEITLRERYDMVCSGIDSVLARYGYRRNGRRYTVDGDGTRDTIALLCHFGSGCAILSHLLGISPVLLWHGLMAPASSVTTIYTEERQPGDVIFRVNSYGDTSHLYAAGEKPAFAGRFCERYIDTHERH